MTTTLEAIRARVVRARQTAEVPPLCISDREFLLRMVDAANETIENLRAKLADVSIAAEYVDSVNHRVDSLAEENGKLKQRRNDRIAELEATLEQVHGALGSVLADVTKLTQLFGRKMEGP